MTLIVDVAPLIALADEREPRRDEILEVMRSERGGLFIPAPVTAEIDYLLGRRFGPRARRAFIEDLASRRYESPGLDARDYTAVLEVDRRYADPDLDLGLAEFDRGARPQARHPSRPHLRRAWLPGPYRVGRSRCCPPTASSAVAGGDDDSAVRRAR